MSESECIDRYQGFKSHVDRVKATHRFNNYQPGLTDFTEGDFRYQEIAPYPSTFTYEMRYLFLITGRTDMPYVVKVWGNRVPYYSESDKVQNESDTRAIMLLELPALLRAQEFEEQVKVIAYSFKDQVVVLQEAQGESLDTYISNNRFSRQQAIDILNIARKYHQKGLTVDMGLGNIFYDTDTGKFQILDPRDATGITWETQLFNFLFFLHNCLNPVSFYGGRRFNYSFEEIKEFFWGILEETESEKTLERMREIMHSFESQEILYKFNGQI